MQHSFKPHFFWLFYWNLYFLLLKSLLSLYFSIEISTFSLLFYWNHNLYFVFTLLLKSLLSLYFSIVYWDLYFLFTFLLKSLLSLYFSIEIFTFSLFFFWDLYPHVRPRHICTSITLQKAIMPCFPQCNHARKNFKEKLCPSLDGSCARPAPRPRRHRTAHSVSHH